MKHYFSLAVLATVALASCTSDEVVETTPVNNKVEKGGITFSSFNKASSRANLIGAEAAALLGNNFVIEGTKGAVSVATNVVFDNYNVKYGYNTAGNSTTNTADWEYVGIAKNANSSISESTQSIKYWDYSAAQYDFIAYSLGTGSATATAITPSTATSSAYTITGTEANLKKCYIADLQTVLNTQFGNEVQVPFRALAAKVRLAIYETIPGYSVRDVEFYESDGATDIITGNVATLYAAGNSIHKDGTYTVFFPTVNSDLPVSDKNKAHLSFASTNSTTLNSYEALDYVRTQASTNETGKYYLGTNSSEATYAGSTANKTYYQVLPNESAEALNLRCNYTLVSNDGTGEVIKVWGATAVVPAIYTQWKSNYAYTYIFKISDATNGSTSGLGGAVKGLHPITFDAVVVNSEEGVQETVSSVTTPSITTYQLGASASGSQDYVAGDIYVMVSEGATLKTDLDTKGQLYTMDAEHSEAEVLDALNMGAVAGDVVTGRNNVVLTKTASDATITAIPGADGNDIAVTAKTAAKFAAAATTCYAYVYKVADGTPTVTNTAVTPANGVDVSGGTYFTDFECTTPATGNADGATVYYQKYTNNNTVYAVKVIKVQ